MSDFNVSRPRRSSSKQHDGNILGISWKEERELRKAMYVSLRQGCHRMPSGNSRSSKNGIPGPLRVTGCRLQWRHRRVTTADRIVAESKLRSAKLRASASLRAVFDSAKNSAIDSRARRQSGGHSENVPKRGTYQKKRPCCKTTSVGTGGTSCKRQHHSGRHLAAATNLKSVKRQPVTPIRNPDDHTCPNVSLRQHPTLISASNDNKEHVQNDAPHVLRQSPQCIRLRSPIKFAPASSQSDSSVSQPLIENVRVPFAPPKSLNDSHADSHVRSPFKLPANPAKRNRTTVFCGTSVEALCRDAQRPLFTDDLIVRSPNRCPNDIVPPELCQDPMGHPVSVHDFVEFVCFRGTPYLDSRLKWFDLPLPLRSSDSPEKSPSPICSADGNNPVLNMHETFSEPPQVSVLQRGAIPHSRKSTLCVAKKLPSMCLSPSSFPISENR